MAIPTYPGVYVEEVSSGVRPITIASTSTAAFIGEAEKGSLDEAVKIYNFTQFQNLYGGFLSGGPYLAHTVYQFFNNGGSQCYILRVSGDNVETARIGLSDRAAVAQRSLTINAVSPGAWGNRIEVVVSDGTRDAGNEFNLQVFYETTPLETTPRETYENLSMIPGKPNFAETATSNSKLIRVMVDKGNHNFTAGTSNGSDVPAVGLTAEKRRLRINIDNDGYQEINLDDAVDPNAPSDSEMVPNLSDAAKVAKAITYMVKRRLSRQRSTTATNAFSNFNCTLNAAGALVLTSGAPGVASSVAVAPAAKSAQDATGLLKLGLLQGGVETLGGAVTRPIANNMATAAGTSRGAGAPDLTLLEGKERLRINVNSDGYREVDLLNAIGVGDGKVADLTSAQNVSDAIQFVVRRFTPLQGGTSPKAYTDFTCTLNENLLLLTSGTKGAVSAVTVSPPTDANKDATNALKLGLAHGGIEIQGSTVAPRYLVGDHSTPAAGIITADVVAGDDGSPVGEDNTFTDAFTRLDNINDVSLLAVPGRGSKYIVGAGMNYCANRPLSDIFFIGDMAQDDHAVLELQTFVKGISPKNSYGAVYAPWLFMLDPTGQSKEPIAVPPSGFVAGMFAKTDTQRGVWKAPAGTAAALAGATGLVVNFTDMEQGNLNEPYHVNLIRQFPAAGRIIWGARTITSDAEWRYVPVRRMAILLRVSIYNGIQWAVFEPNDEPLWGQLRLNIRSFMTSLFRRGAFQGATPSQAFFVKCDGETTTQDDIDNGIVNVLVGFAPLKPAEFIMVKISQKAGQSS